METLSTGVIQIGSHFEGYLVARVNGKAIWRDFAKVLRLTADDAKADCLKMAEDYKAINKVA